mmetsp:Transcript_33388/g.38859  ORF Transcript_33388/g.38859 Transcript_33388/m.38859 type:complete len:162 (+) Transcript_33388:131-616(+)
MQYDNFHTLFFLPFLLRISSTFFINSLLLGVGIGVVPVESKICVATAEDRYLCTDDAAKARAYRIERGEIVDYESLDLGVEQEIEGTAKEKDDVKDVLQEMKKYFETEVLVKPEYESVIGNCKNHQKLCAFWTSVGECENNRGFMIENCAAACRSCLATLK